MMMMKNKEVREETDAEEEDNEGRERGKGGRE